MAIPASNTGNYVGKDQAKHFLCHPEWQMHIPNPDTSPVLPVLVPHPGLALQMQIMRCLGKKEDQFGFKTLSPPRCFGVQFWRHLSNSSCASPVSTTLVSARLETQPGKYQRLWKPPSSSRLAAQPACCQKNPCSPPSPILLIGPRFAQTGNCYWPL